MIRRTNTLKVVALFGIILTFVSLILCKPLTAISTIWVECYLLLALFDYARYCKYVHTEYEYRAMMGAFVHALLMSIVAFYFFLYTLMAQYYVKEQCPVFFYLLPVGALSIHILIAVKQDMKYELEDK